ncbi:metallophosphoesterase family protein [Paraburkholderia metrosideri]|uniref:Calcineurin-like phosphoesterase domain-containing protein n=1 Tax=Paraburkholderia metrosideri TaxID=580937 RepID=A0ABN7HVK2_9BURK|nr:metallophosphoesterase family protein [Paraburkholderia metrosideri]CAD6540245.1 hypothetical protein LMG28140_03477 [Paraburkholderia metrosideri]
MLAILSDIHGNLAALEAVVANARSRGCTRFISLGDVVGYYSKPGECIDLLRSLGATNILGNHDSYITMNESCPRSRVVTEIIQYQKGILSAAQVAWLGESLDMLRESDYLFVHGGPENTRDQYLYSVSPAIIPDGVRILFSGHTHVQTLARFGDRAYCNPGSIGQPRDGDNRAAYAIVDDSEVSLHRVTYDIQQTADAMKSAGFEPFTYQNLFHGTQIGGRVDQIRIIQSKED